MAAPAIHEYTGTVTRVVDGDTIDCQVSVEVDVGFGVSATFRAAHRVRLAGINCPEVHGASRDRGLDAAAFTRDRLLGKEVRLVAFKAEDGEFRSDSFGRWLAKVYLGDDDFNQQLIDAGHAVPFMALAFPVPTPDPRTTP